MGETRIRIYVGGLGANVKEDDLKKTFASLGNVESVELNRNKGRSFGYMEFIPSSDKSLSKLFSAYNGCMWKGGKLKLEKAKEHYLSRLKREWTEDAEIAAAKLAKLNVEPDEVVRAPPTKFKADQDMEKMQIKVYFPKLRKIRPLPYKGTGKHKYSFQRVEVPPLPINFCDCEEHSAPASAYAKEFFRPPAVPASGNTKEFFRPPVSAKRNDANDIEPEAFAVTEQELDIMKSVLNKLVEKENSSSKISNESKFTKKINHPVTAGDNSQVDDSEEDQVSDHNDDDDDDVVINVGGRSSNRVDPFENWRPKATANQVNANESKFTKKINHPVTAGDNSQVDDSEEDQVSDYNDDNDDDVVINVGGQSSNRVDPFEDWRPKATANQDSLSTEVESLTRSQKSKLQNDKKRKASVPETVTNDDRASKRMMSNDNLSSNSVPKPTELCSEAAPVRKTAWKNLVTERGSTSFKISDILTGLNPKESKLESVAPSSNKIDIEDGKTDKTIESDNLSDDQSMESAESESESLESAENESQSMESAESESGAEESIESESQAGDSTDSESQAEESDKSESQSMEAAENESKSKEVAESESPESAEFERQDDQTNENKLKMPSVVNKTNESSEPDNKAARGAAWLHKLSWAQLVADASSTSFSFSEILPSGTSEKQELPKYESNVFPDSKDENFLAGDTSNPRGRVEEALVEKEDDAGVDKIKIASDGDKKVEPNKRAFVRDVVISETCPFMRSAASVKEWAKTKAALNGSLKKKAKKVKEIDSD